MDPFQKPSSHLCILSEYTKVKLGVVSKTNKETDSSARAECDDWLNKQIKQQIYGSYYGKYVGNIPNPGIDGIF